MRILTFILGILVAAAVIAYPRFIAEDMKSVPHGWLVVLHDRNELLLCFGNWVSAEKPLTQSLFLHSGGMGSGNYRCRSAPL